MQKLLGCVRKAIDTYNMIDDGDCVAVGVSGGKDSLVLLNSLALLKNFYTKKFEVKAITLDLGYEGGDYLKIADFCKMLNIEYIIEKTQIKQIVFDIRKEKNPCSLCANLRRGALNNAALKHGCKCVALGHHYDDVIETFMLSLLYEGRINCFSPVTYLEKAEIKLIRPLILTNEYYIKSISRRYELPVSKSPCPADKNTKREEIKSQINLLSENNPEIRKRIFSAVKKSGIGGWKIN